MSDPWTDASPTWRSCLSRHAILLVALVTLARLLYIAYLCPYDLIEDEAQYWVWSLRPDWSYYSKGPGIAWSIWLSTHLLGVSEWGVRALAPVYSAVAALAVGGLAADALRNRRAAVFGSAVFLLIPLFTLNGTFLMTIDGPLLAFWAAACWAGFRALYRSSGSAWIVLGVMLGVGFLFKYTMLLLIPGLAIGAWIDRRSLSAVRPVARWLALGLVFVVLGLIPVVAWNDLHGWPTVKHFIGHAKLPGGDQGSSQPSPSYSPKWTFEFIGIQAGAVGPALVLMWWGFRRMASSAARSGAVFLLWAGLPTLLFYLLATFFTSVEGNWPMAGFVSLAALGGIGAMLGMDEWRARVARWRAIPAAERPREGLLLKRPESIAQVAWHATLVYGILATLLLLRIDWIARIPPLGSEYFARHKVPILGVPVETHRLIGARTLARGIERLSKEYATVESGPPLLISYHYGVAAQLTFYLRNHPMVLVAGSRLGYRRTQWDLWPDLSLSNPALRGKNAILIGGEADQWRPLFEGLVELKAIPEDPRQARYTRIGEHFRGVPGDSSTPGAPGAP